MSKYLPVFVYGTLLEGFHNYELYVKPYRHEALPAEIRGELFDLPDGYPGLLSGASVVKGSVYIFSEDDYAKALNDLDELETYYGPGDARNEYEREEVLATVEGEEHPWKVYVYRYIDENYVKTVGARVENGDWRSFRKGSETE